MVGDDLNQVEVPPSSCAAQKSKTIETRTFQSFDSYIRCGVYCIPTDDRCPKNAGIVNSRNDQPVSGEILQFWKTECLNNVIGENRSIFVRRDLEIADAWMAIEKFDKGIGQFQIRFEVAQGRECTLAKERDIMIVVYKYLDHLKIRQ